MMDVRSSTFACLVVALALGVLGVVAEPHAQLPDGTRLAFLQAGDVWISDADGRQATRLTQTGGEVEDFRFAPSGDYLALARTVFYVDDPGLYDDNEKPPQRSVQAIEIMDVGLRRTIGEIPPGDGWVYFDKWIPGGRLLGHSASGFDITGVFEYDVSARQRRDLEYEAGARLIEGDVSPYGTLMAYMDDIGVGAAFEQRLHIVDRASETDTIRATRRSILKPRIANGNGAVVFVEVINEPESSRDRAWVLTLPEGSLTTIHENIARPKSWGTEGLSWSPDDHYVTMNFAGTIVIIDVTGNAPRATQIAGTGACWITERALVARGPEGIDVYDVTTGNRHPLVPGASKPQCLLPAN